MPSLPPAADEAQHPPLTALSRVDGCPACVVNAEMPSSAYATGDGYLCNYVCLDCGHAWATSWAE